MSVTAIYPVLTSKIQTILEGISKIKVIYAYPATKLDSYPAALYFPSVVENSFETTSDNFKIYNYKLFIVINAGNKSVLDIFNTVMPNVMDEVLNAFDAGWDFDTIDGHRAWGKIDTGYWQVSQEQGGIEITAEIDLSVKILTNN